MLNLIVVNNPKFWPLHVPGVSVVAARSYLTDPQYNRWRGLRVFNLCRSYRYQSTGYYVSLLAMARGHKPFPNVTTIQDMKTAVIARELAGDLEELIQRRLKRLFSRKFTLSIYFGRNLAKRYDDLSAKLFRLFPVPLLRAEFVRENGDWQLQNIGPISGSDIPESHRPFIVDAAKAFFAQKRIPSHRKAATQFDLAVLTDEKDPLPPSNKGALRKFEAAAKRLGFEVEFIDREDFARLAEFDGLFIRDTTYVNHYTYRFARRANAIGLVVIDDPDSIVRCTNKVYLAELLRRNLIPIPKTLIVHRDNRDDIATQIGMPCILKVPDSSFSQGVVKVENDQQLQEAVDAMLERSSLIIAQEFVPTDFDWRIGLIDRQPLYACRYYMVKEHWQIYKTQAGRLRDGDVEAVPLDLVPRPVLSIATRAARLIGDGLYGVDVKQVGRKAMVIEINDNPSIDHGVEDVVLKSGLYDRIMRVFLERIQRQKRRRGEPV